MRAPERRAQLLEVARRMFGRDGFHSVSMDTVAREAGVTKPILYDHFPSKRELYLAMLDADLESLEAGVRTALEKARGNLERVRGSFRAYFEFVDEQAAGFRLLMTEAVGAEGEFRRRVAAVRDRIMADVARVIERESKGRLDAGEADTVALALVGMVETVAQHDPGGSAESRRRALDVTVRLAWRGITGLKP